VVDQISIDQPKTKDFIRILDNLKVDGTALLVTNNPDQNLQLSTRNVSYVGVTTSESLNTYDTLKYDRIIITRDAFSGLQSRLS
jgi:large subunit ribosomal protein L4